MSSSPTWSQVALQRLLVENGVPRPALGAPPEEGDAWTRRRLRAARGVARRWADGQRSGWGALVQRARAGDPLGALVFLEDTLELRPRTLLAGWLWGGAWEADGVPAPTDLSDADLHELASQDGPDALELRAWLWSGADWQLLTPALGTLGLDLDGRAIFELALIEARGLPGGARVEALAGGLYALALRRATRGEFRDAALASPQAMAARALALALLDLPHRPLGEVLRDLAENADFLDEDRALLDGLLEMDGARSAKPTMASKPTAPARSPEKAGPNTGLWSFEIPIHSRGVGHPVLASAGVGPDDLLDDVLLAAEITSPEPEAAPPARTLNLGLSADGRAPLDLAEPVPAEGWLYALIQVGPPTGWSAVKDPTPLPDDLSAAIEEEGGEVVGLTLSSPDFEIEGAPPAPEGEWQVLERPLHVPPRAPTELLSLRIRPRRAGRLVLRVALYFRGALAQAARLQATVGVGAPNPSYEAVIEYTAAPGLAALRALTPRALTLWINDVAGTHALGVRSGELQVSRALSLRPDQLGLLAAAARAALVEAGTLVEDDKRKYRFAEAAGRPANTGTPEGLRAALLGLARLGYGLYGELLPQDLRGALVPALRVPTTLSVARLAEGEVLPWALIYDRRLDLDAVTADDVCLRLIPGGGQPVVEPAACRASPDCPLNDPERARRTVCPWAFWGFKHAIEQPAQRAEPGREPRALVTEIQGPVRLDMNVYPDFPRLPAHRPRVEALADAFVYAGDDRGPGAAPALRSVRAALSDRELTAIYFYCHGGEIQEDGVWRPYLAVGRNRERLRPLELGENDDDTGAPVYAWPRHPLVFLNGCETAAIEPRVLMHFVDAFANAGAAGVIGTEVPVWEALATEVGEGFLRRFLQEGLSVGEAIRAVRLELLARYNPLGLVYTVYASADLRFKRG